MAELNEAVTDEVVDAAAAGEFPAREDGGKGVGDAAAKAGVAPANGVPLDTTTHDLGESVVPAVDATAETEVASGSDVVSDPDSASNATTASDSSDDAADYDDDSEDSLTYSNGVIEKIVALATREVPHVLGMKGNLMHFVQEQFGAENLTKGVTVEVTDDNRVIVNISVIIEYGSYAPSIFEDVKERVTERLGSMTGLEVAGINLRIEDVVTREEYEAGQKHLIDSLKSSDDEKTGSEEE